MMERKYVMIMMSKDHSGSDFTCKIVLTKLIAEVGQQKKSNRSSNESWSGTGTNYLNVAVISIFILTMTVFM